MNRGLCREAIFTVAVVSLFAVDTLVAQPNRGDLEIYETAIDANAGATGSTQPNLLFIADTSGSMGNHVPVEYVLDKGAYDPAFDYGGDGAAADDGYIYVYDDLETFSGVIITPAQNKCKALTTTHTNSPGFPLFTGKVLQWQPVRSSVEITPEVVCETTSAPPSSATIPSRSASNTNWRSFHFDPSQSLDQDDFLAGTSVTLQMTNTGPRGAKGGIRYIPLSPSGTQIGLPAWLCYRNQWRRGTTNSCSGDIDDIPYPYYRLSVQFQSRRDSTTMEGTLTYNEGAPETQVDPSCVPADAVTAAGPVSDGEWSGSLATSSDSDSILECEKDAGVHGIADSSTDVEAAFCGAASCIAPRYVAAGGIDWLSAGLSEKFLYTGNYHDYLQYRPPPPGTVYDTRTDWYIHLRDAPNYDSWRFTGPKNAAGFCDLFTDYDRIGTNPYDSTTWSPVISRPIAPNTIFLEDSLDGTGFVYICSQKQQTMINALTDMATSISGVNMGLMRFNTNDQGGSVIYHVQSIDGSTERAALVSAIAGLPAEGSTPLAETMSEAYRYLSGGSKHYSESAADPAAFSATDDSVYESPITGSCQSTNIIYLTDGEPRNDADAEREPPGVCGGISCLDEWADYMATTDVHTSVRGHNRVTTYTVGFAIDFPLLAETAQKGGGEYFTADSYDDLILAFQEILLDINISGPSTLVAPAVSVNAFNELKHNSQIYYATFAPSFRPAWEGNVKRYAITGEGIVYGQGGPGAPAIGEDGFFKSSAQSFWSDFPDGPRVAQGGYREQLTNNRKVYLESSVVTGGGSGIIPLTGSSNLDTAAFGVADPGEAEQLRDWMLGIDVDDYDGDNSVTDAHRYAAESLHSKPVVVTYSGSNAEDAFDILFVATNMGSLHAIDVRPTAGAELWSYTPEELVGNIKTYRDNSAALRHWSAYGLDGEATVWAEEAADSTVAAFNIGNVYMYQGMRRGGDTYYAWDVSNADLGVNASAPPISNLWQINGGVGLSASPGFSDLGYTWSKMIRTRIRYSCTDTGCMEKDVLVFSGGYHDHYDTETNVANSGDETVDILGNAVYVVDALTGDLLWSTGSAASADSHDLTLPVYNSIPGDPSPLDVDGDGAMDTLFFIDISGAVFRVDFDQSKPLGSAYATGGMIADLSESSAFRRFYNGLDISLVTPTGESSYLAISVGSGYRAHPTKDEAWANRFYVLIDENINSAEAFGYNSLGQDEEAITYNYVKTYDADAQGREIIHARAVITSADLHAYSASDPYDKGRKASGEDEPDGEHGFYRNLDTVNHEKILQSSVTFGGEILVGSYLPAVGSATCESGQIGTGRFYRFNVATGRGAFGPDDGNSEDNVIDSDGDGYGDYIELDHEGIPPEPVILLVPELVTCVGTECSDNWLNPEIEIGQATRIYWREQNNR